MIDYTRKVQGSREEGTERSRLIHPPKTSRRRIYPKEVTYAFPFHVCKTVLSANLKKRQTTPANRKMSTYLPSPLGRHCGHIHPSPADVGSCPIGGVARWQEGEAGGWTSVTPTPVVTHVWQRPITLAGSGKRRLLNSEMIEGKSRRDSRLPELVFEEGWGEIKGS